MKDGTERPPIPRWQDLEAVMPEVAELLRRGPRDVSYQSKVRCSVCGLPLVSHPRCKGCGLLVGKDHVSERTAFGYCLSCLQSKARKALRLEK